MSPEGSEAPSYIWNRFWCPPTGSLPLWDQGFLVDPESDSLFAETSDLADSTTISQYKCLILLGEPGIGKSWALNALAAESPAESLKINLRSFGSEDALREGLFNSHPLANWVRSEGELYLFLDSLDECLLRIDHVASILADGLRHLPAARLALRIACRTGEWPWELEAEFRELWKEADIGIFELAPLRRRDVHAAAEAHSLDADEFVSEVLDRSVVPLAIKPLTLNFLLKEASRGPLSENLVETYHRGCLLLASELRPLAGPIRSGSLDSGQKLAVAARLAAVTVFSNRDAIWRAADAGDVPSQDVPLWRLAGGQESLWSAVVDVSEGAIRETLGSGLFSSRGENRFGWAHQTYAEFLSARYVTAGDLEAERILDLVTHPSDPDRRVLPQLQEVASWMATLRPDVMRLLIRRDPLVVMLSDVAALGDSSRRQLVDSLVESADSEQSPPFPVNLRRRLTALGHSSLDDQLREILPDRDRTEQVRDLAIDIAEACRVESLDQSLVDIALDRSESRRLRTNAALAVSRIGNDSARSQLRPLLNEPDDDDDEFFAAALRSLWPSELSTEEVFRLVRSPKRESFFGNYRVFLLTDLLGRLSVDEIPIALEWVRTQPSTFEASYAIADLIDRVIEQASRNQANPHVQAALVAAVRDRFDKHDEVKALAAIDRFGLKDHPDDAARRELLLKLLSGANDRLPGSLTLSSHPLIVGRDVPWLAAVARSWPDLRETAIQILIRVIDARDPRQAMVLMELAQDVPETQSAARFLFEAVPLDSPDAQQMRIAHRRTSEQFEEDELPTASADWLPVILSFLDRADEGDREAWVALGQHLEGNEPTFSGNALETDITRLPGWLLLEQSVKSRVVAIGARYIESAIAPDQWVTAEGAVTYGGIAGLRAFRLLMSEAPEQLERLASETWVKWSHVITWYPYHSGTEEASALQALYCQGSRVDANAFMSTLLARFEADIARSTYIFALDLVSSCANDATYRILLDWVQGIGPGPYGQVMEWLIAHEFGPAVEVAEQDMLSRDSKESRDRALMAAKALLLHALDAGWRLVYSEMSKDPSFGRDLMLEFAEASHTSEVRLGERLSEREVADLFVWLYREFPPDEDPQFDGVHAVGPRELVGNLRDGLLVQLRARGTDEAVAAMRTVVTSFPGLPWLKWLLAETEAEMRRQTWIPPEPETVLAYVSQSGAALVEGGEQLMDLLQASLERLQTLLQGETAHVRFLWESRDRGIVPRTEPDLTDFLKTHLEEDLTRMGVILNREVEVRRGLGSGIGERTDIHVDAVSQLSSATYERIKAVIEVKGNWNPGLFRDMEGQLAKRYLLDSGATHGIYLVGWFASEAWADDDWRRDRAEGLELENVRSRLAAEAKAISQRGMVSIRAMTLDLAWNP